MPELVQVSSVDNQEKLKTNIGELFKKGKYAEITQSIGIFSILIDANHTIRDQRDYYRSVLGLIKERISRSKVKDFGAWYVQFPRLLDELIGNKLIVTDAAALDAMASHRSAYGAFRSLDDFFFWCLDDRRLPLEQIVKYIDRTAEMQLA